jgi:hypothetical protein
VKVLLTILCGLMILFSGGCFLALGGTGNPFALVNLLILVPNILVIAALYGLSNPIRPVFIALAVVDFLVALIIGGLALATSGTNIQVQLIGLLIAIAFVAKGVFTWSVSNRSRTG